ncbi:bifunctional precorrin-2 dehydrogenase/sirohydrochlorin ferrochelatase [Fusobacterium ulcerans]|jgi:precorrin-2 dehydrogenase/sirohydrochlorin ferrochelatase|uniref:precorrin-2 dehydrogenase n=1 Tax=Fusobacterium ulcerans 12-1B TaxID=457404 RepID=H1PYC3_9FUSO|nr:MULTISPECIES: bifunctional precorrin-2 dehydrogenase/sirohydrochlorin ferrochelatase [Fusobacterium]EHO77423.1 siroheme synthase domain-containing protein [Fusobacterium ulcerans 12-1B]MDH6458296.1 precorrin-2 dehydrogenase/sirohydrochlorin ferrochelatase [Fusobacterium sp. PH5-7]MEE0137129.1 bifunctional precorrin-2 dehydrogenase/sirohydrochlorin ferrochelatase [Fusobacterium ulcerans]RGY64208.1 bifunctional precorrin-2 dehydrogenase/sirohydrochlorin ferrochelatase [Fusobacterium ulcerans]
MENNFFPVFLNMQNKKVLIIGAGKIAFRKAETLLSYGAKIKVIAKDIKEEKFKELENIELSLEDFKEDMLENVFMVIAATDDFTFNKYIFNLCDKKNILTNNITSKTEMNCRFSSIYENDEYQIAISAKGDPKKSKTLKEKISKLFND